MDVDRCEHPRTAHRRRILSNGSKSFCVQCLDCGSQVGGALSPRNLAPSVLAALTDWDDGLGKHYWAERQMRWREQLDAQREAESEEWRARYNAHLQSPKWHSLRRRVFKRADGICEGCGLRAAIQVHHLTYARLGDEMLFDLAAICLDCHARLHPHHAGGEE